MMKRRLPCLLVPALLALAGSALAQDATTPGAVSSPYPTFHNLSIEWQISGDDDNDSVVTVRWRAKGDATFRDGLPLSRVPAGSNEGFSWANRHAGSVFGLLPGTTYEVELTLTDPDGGDATELVTATTRAFPVPMPGAPEIAVTPATLDAALDAAAPGDILVLEDGTYGEIVVPNDGADGQPIVLRAKNAGGAVVEGDVRMDSRSHVHVEGLTVHGKLKLNDASHIVVRGCVIETPENGIISYGTGVTNAFIVDNVITGPTQWNEAALGASGDNLGEGVQITGPGNVVAFNRVTGFRDCLSLLEDAEAVNQVSIDFYGNDLDVCADDAIEADFSMGNVRVYGNRIHRSFMGLSSQPSLGGPTYFVRNVMYDIVFQTFKLQRSSVGDVGLHNTAVKSGDAFSVNTSDVFSRAFFRNNLFLGGPGAVYNGYDSGAGAVMYLPSADPSCSFDHDGYGAIGAGAFTGQVGATKFATFEEMKATTTEVHGVQVDLDVFEDAVAYPSDPFDVPGVPSFALSPGGAAVDKGTPLPGINDGFGGAAPDLGAIELGQAQPVYGPGGTLGSGGGGAGGGSGGGGAAGGNGPGGGGHGQGGDSTGGSDTGGSGGSGAGEESCGCRVAGGSGGGRSAPIATLAALAGLALVARRRRCSGGARGRA